MLSQRVVMAATLLTLPNQVIKKLNSMVFSFIWGQRDRISRKKVIKPISKGGLGMVDIEKLFDSFKAFWLNRLFPVTIKLTVGHRYLTCN